MDAMPREHMENVLSTVTGGGYFGTSIPECQYTTKKKHLYNLTRCKVINYRLNYSSVFSVISMEVVHNIIGALFPVVLFQIH